MKHPTRRRRRRSSQTGGLISWLCPLLSPWDHAFKHSFQTRPIVVGRPYPPEIVTTFTAGRQYLPAGLRCRQPRLHEEEDALHSLAVLVRAGLRRRLFCRLDARADKRGRRGTNGFRRNRGSGGMSSGASGGASGGLTRQRRPAGVRGQHRDRWWRRDWRGRRNDREWGPGRRAIRDAPQAGARGRCVEGHGPDGFRRFFSRSGRHRTGRSGHGHAGRQPDGDSLCLDIGRHDQRVGERTGRAQGERPFIGGPDRLVHLRDHRHRDSCQRHGHHQPRCRRRRRQHRQASSSETAIWACRRTSGTCRHFQWRPVLIPPTGRRWAWPTSTPEWWRDAKFGAWAHWDPQSMPEQGDWYAYRMYQQGSADFNYHVAHFGDPSGVRLQGHLPELGDRSVGSQRA